MAPVRYKCERVEIFPATEKKPALVMDDCAWEVDDGVKAVTLECEGSKNRYFVTRNMDDARDKYPWRISRFDMESGEPIGHTYGKDPADTLNKHIAKYEKCRVVKVRTASGRDDFGRAKFEKLTKTLSSSAPSLEARRVLAAFLRGETARGACRGKGSARTCAIVSTGRTLEVTGNVVASREGRKLTVCVPPSADMQQRGKKRRETEEAKDVRVAASILLRRVAGMGVRTSAQGDRLLSAKGRASMLFPAACVQVQVPKREVALILTTTSAVEAARARFKTQYPSQKQIQKMRDVLQAEKRTAALLKAQGAKRAKRDQLPQDEFDVRSAPEDVGAPFDVDAMLEPVFPPDAGLEEEAPPKLPSNVDYPTDPSSYMRFVHEYLPQLRKGPKRDAALAWQAYLLDPKNVRRPGTSTWVTEETQRAARIARAVEIDIAGEYGIVDPNYGFTAPDDARRSGQQRAAQKRAAATRARKGKGRGPGWVSDVVREQLLKNTDYEMWERLYGRKSRG